MEQPALPFSMEYRCTPHANLVRYEVVAGGKLDRRWWHCMQWQPLAITLFLQVFATLAAVMSGNALVACVLGVGMVWFLKDCSNRFRSDLASFDRSLSLCSADVLKVDVSDRGFLEHDRGVESFCPWSAMKNYCIAQDVLMVEMANDLWAIIPAETLKPDTIRLGDLEKILIEHGVSRRSN